MAVYAARLVRPWFIVTLIALAFALLVVGSQGDARALVTLGTRFTEGDPAGSEGYDGQFVYFIARDPSTAATFIAQGDDVAAYRFQRILLPILGRALALGQESLIPWTLLLINVIALAVGTALLETLLVEQNVSRWYALGYGLSIAGVGCVRLSLTEPLAYGLVIGGIYLATRERWLLSALVFALAALSKETTLIVAAGYGLWMLFQLVSPFVKFLDQGGERQIIAFSPSMWRGAGGWVNLISFSLIALVPFIAWQFILRQHFGMFGVGSGGNLATSFELVPFMGVIRILTEGSPAAFALLMVFIGPFVLLPSIWGLYRCFVDMREGKITALTCLLFTTSAIMLFVPFSTYREPLGILRFIAGLQIALILYAAERKLRRPLRYSTLWAMTTLLVFNT